jgi:hypothetical protein
MLSRGEHCPRERQHLREMAKFHDWCAVALTQLVTIIATGGYWPLLSDGDLKVQLRGRPRTVDRTVLASREPGRQHQPVLDRALENQGAGMGGIAKESFDSPDEARTPDKTRLDVVDLGTAKAARMTGTELEIGAGDAYLIEPGTTLGWSGTRPSWRSSSKAAPQTSSPGLTADRGAEPQLGAPCAHGAPRL